ncbi:GTP-binding protein [Colletotrichum higginsianum]|uniref:GTP-binding protein n=1 Tax=Colletotrichum higginsianum (strain IMI 349063) TaxID=759273 RepID=H1V159_COLHI|nr:GTP-binding protein [Colletotrichum higginsianum]
MTSKTIKSLPHEKRKGEAALSDFADYVEKQQALRYPSSKSADISKVPTAAPEHQHAELDELFDNLDLAEATSGVRLKDLLLGTDGGTLQQLEGVVQERILEGHGEAIFELGFESNGESMALTLSQWNDAYTRLKDAAKRIRADCQTLITKNVDGEMDASSAKPGKENHCSGKILIRQAPATVEDVIETRIAVVGNGMFLPYLTSLLLVADSRGPD